MEFEGVGIGCDVDFLAAGCHVLQYQKIINGRIVESNPVVFCDADETYGCNRVAALLKEVAITVKLILFHVQELAPRCSKTSFHVVYLKFIRG